MVWNSLNTSFRVPSVAPWMIGRLNTLLTRNSVYCYEGVKVGLQWCALRIQRFQYFCISPTDRNALECVLRMLLRSYSWLFQKLELPETIHTPHRFYNLRFKLRIISMRLKFKLRCITLCRSLVWLSHWRLYSRDRKSCRPRSRLLQFFKICVGNTNAFEHGRPRGWSGHFNVIANVNFQEQKVSRFECNTTLNLLLHLLIKDTSDS